MGILTRHIEVPDLNNYTPEFYPDGTEKHISLDGARYHVLSYGTTVRCSAQKCEYNLPDKRRIALMVDSLSPSLNEQGKATVPSCAHCHDGGCSACGREHNSGDGVARLDPAPTADSFDGITARPHAAGVGEAVPPGLITIPSEPTPALYERFLGRVLLNMDKPHYERWSRIYREVVATLGVPGTDSGAVVMTIAEAQKLGCPKCQSLLPCARGVPRGVGGNDGRE